MQLDPIIQSKVDEFVDASYDYFQKENYIETFKLIDRAWDTIPPPKENYFESFNIAKYIFEYNLILLKFDEAERWLNEIKKVKIKHPSSWDAGQVEFLEGKLYFEKNDLDKAKELFIIAMRDSKGRQFSDEPKKYVDLLKKK
jgi:tetratricopeptide (TPR) repeat protein